MKGGVVQVDGEVDDFNVRRWHSPNGDWLYLYCKPLWGSEPYRLLVKATIMLYELGAQIQGKYNIQISYEDVLQSPEFDDPKDPVAKFWGDYYGAVVKTRKGNGFDRSTGEWSREFTMDEIADYVDLGSNVAEIGNDVDEGRSV